MYYKLLECSTYYKLGENSMTTVKITNKGNMWHLLHGHKVVGFATTLTLAKAKASQYDRESRLAEDVAQEIMSIANMSRR